jgi:Uma2 family endonuclease
MVVAADVAHEQVKLRPLKRAEYDSLVESGAFAGERLELINGVMVETSPQDARHAFAVQQLTAVLSERLRGRAITRIQLPIALSDDSEPEPDVAVVALGDYRNLVDDRIEVHSKPAGSAYTHLTSYLAG